MRPQKNNTGNKHVSRYSSIPCFDLFHMTEEHTHILKYCEWAGEEVPCQVSFINNGSKGAKTDEKGDK